MQRKPLRTKGGRLVTQVAIKDGHKRGRLVKDVEILEAGSVSLAHGRFEILEARN